MPPHAGVRKASLISNTPSLANGGNEQRRTNSGRAVRANTTRPANYYARPFALNAPDETEEAITPLGFFPAVTFFTDAITALPREVVRQFTLMKEAEAKLHKPAEQLGDICDELMKYPVPTRRDGQLQSALLMSFTAPNSKAGSANASVINGIAPYASRYGQDSVAGSVMDEDFNLDGEETLHRRRKYGELRALAHSMLPNMDEKNVVLTEAIRRMNAQLSRIDGVMPYVEAEIPEEARLGSMTHWAYSDNRIRTKATTAQASRRDVVATNNLAAAAHAVHETEIAQTRREAGKETRNEKFKGGRNRGEQVDSEFEEKPRKLAKTAKGKVGAAVTGLGLGLGLGLGISTNGEPVKRRKVEKTGVVVPSMERQVSGMGRQAAKPARDAPRNTPSEDVVKMKVKAPKAVPAPTKRRGLNSAQASPALGSGSLPTQIPPNGMDPPGARPQSVRLRQNSSTSNLRHERLMNDDAAAAVAAAGSRPGSANGKSNGSSEKSVPRKRPREEAETEATNQIETIEKSTEGGVSPARMEENNNIQPTFSRSDSNKTPSGGASKVGTPRSDNFASTDAAPMSRTRSTRSGRGKEESVTAEPASQKVQSHKRNGGGVGSMSGLMRQIAPFNKSPDLDRHASRDDTDNSSNGEGRGEQRQRAEEQGSAQPSRSVSRRASSPREVSEIEARRGDIVDGVDEAKDGREQAREQEQQEHELGSEDELEDGNIDNIVDEDEQEQEEAYQTADIAHAAGATDEEDVADQDMIDPSEPPALIPDADDEEDEPESPSPSLTPVGAVLYDEPQEEPVDEEMDDEAADDEAEGDVEEADADEDGDDPDPDDPNEPKYCYCMRGSYGDMVGCDNTDCPREWFHLGCTGLKRMPTEEESWYCDFCKPAIMANRRRGAARGRGRA